MPNRCKLTMQCGDDLARAFNALGPGYQERMNRVLRTWMLGRAVVPPDVV